MQVSNTEWQLAGDATPASLTMQNVGITRIAIVFASALPAVDAIALDSDEHFILAPAGLPYTETVLATWGLSAYVRSLGPIAGKLAINSHTT